MSLNLIIGPMFSGKTTELIRQLNKFSSVGQKCIYINSSLDIRETANFSSHNPSLKKIGDNIDSVKIDNMNNHFINSVIQYDIIGIDESQLFKNNMVSFVLRLVEEHKKQVIVSGLNGDFLRNKFGSILDLIPYCDNVTKLTAYCGICSLKGIIKNAHFSKRKDTSITDVIEISYTSYIPVCRECYNKKNEN